MIINKKDDSVFLRYIKPGELVQYNFRYYMLVSADPLDLDSSFIKSDICLLANVRDGTVITLNAGCKVVLLPKAKVIVKGARI